MLIAPPKKRSYRQMNPQELAGPKKQKKKETKVPQDAIGSVVPLAVNETDVFRPAAHLAPSDVKIVSGGSDKRKAFALHSFILKMR